MRYYKVRQLEMLQKVSWVLAPQKKWLCENVFALKELIEDYELSIKQLVKLSGKLSRKSVNATYVKKGSKIMMVDAVMKLSKAATAYSQRRKEELASVDFTRSQLTRPKPEVVAERCKLVIDTAKSIGAIKQYGIKPEDIQAAEKHYEVFLKNMHSPKQEKNTMKKERAELNQLIDECVVALEKQIDGLVEIACESNRSFFTKYKSARKVLKVGMGRLSLKEESYLNSRKKKKTK